MAKKNVLQNFTSYSISESESKALKGGRSNNTVTINTGSFGFINWDDIDVRGSGFVVSTEQSAGILKTSKKSR